MTNSTKIRTCISAIVVLVGCTYKDIPTPTEVVVDCSLSTFAISEADKTNPSSCLSIDGSFAVHASGGASPYQFSFNGGSFQSDSILSNLGPGTYLVTAKDANSCTRSLSVVLSVAGSSLSATAATVDDTECLGDNGSFVITPTGGTGPYTFQLGSAAEVSSGSFSNLKSGYYVVTVRDSNSPRCLVIVNVWVHRGSTGISYSGEIQPILMTNCAIGGCHNGDNGANINWTVFANVKRDAQNIRIRTGNRSMPAVGSLTQDQIDQIACWVEDGANNN